MGRPRKSKYEKYLQKSTPDEVYYGHIIAHAYESGNVNGWPGEDVAREAFNLLQQPKDANKASEWFDLLGGPQPKFVKLNLPIQANGKMMLYQFARKLLGADTKNYPQQIGDCVSFGAKNACEHLLCVQNVLGVSPNKFRPVFPPYLYGCGRVFVGHQNNYEDGSVGSWQASAVQKYGVLASDEEGVPAYAGKVAKNWGGGQGPPQNFVTLAKTHLVKSAAQINSWNDLVAAITNGYPCTVASNQGFAMQPDGNGFHAAKGSWAHQMCIIGVDNTYKTPYAIILNSWGDVHGKLKDFETQEDLPVGTLRVRSDTIERMLRQQDTFAFSQMDWFQEQKLPEDLFKLL
jgi:hypothetical protein